MRSETLREASERVLELEDAQAEALAAAGRRLASNRRWWGGDVELAADRTVVRVEPRGTGRWSVYVADAVGVLSVGDLQIVVEPKIPLNHLLYLFEESRALPRLDDQRASVEATGSLWRLVAEWFVREGERLLRRDLMRDYEERVDDVPAVRGRIEALATARLFYSGRLQTRCEYEEFGLDTALNRVLKAAAGEVAGSPLLEPLLRRRAIRLLARFDEVGGLRPGDLAAGVERRTGHYASTLTLARQVLQSEGRAVRGGEAAAWTFLIRTPDMVEEGVRRAISARFAVGSVTKVGRAATGSSITFTPDLVFSGDGGVGDIKYKVATGEWTRPDLYQAIAFAEAFGANRAAIVQFAGSGSKVCADLLVGATSIREIRWPTDTAVTPEAAADAVASQLAAWTGLPMVPAGIAPSGSSAR